MKLNYNPYAKHFTIESENGSNLNTLSLKWSTGRMDINIADLLPCTAKKFTLLLDTIKISEHENENISLLSDFIKQACSFFGEWIKKEYDAKRKAGYIAELKKWKKHYDALCKRYDLEKIDNAEIVKYKSAYVYRMQGKAGSATITRYSGFTFEKYGYTLQVYKTDRKAHFEVIVPCFGLYIVTGSSKAAAVAAFTEEIAGKLKKIIETSDSEKTRNNFINAMTESGFEYVLEDPLYSAPVFHEEQPEKEPETAAETEAEKPVVPDAETAAAADPVVPETDFLTESNYQKYTVKNPITGEIVPLRYNGNEGYVFVTLDINGILKVFSNCKYKYHENIYSLKIAYKEKPKDARRQPVRNALKLRNDRIIALLQGIPAAAGKNPGHVVRTAEKPLLYRPMQAVADPMKLYRHGITIPGKTGLQGFIDGKTGKLYKPDLLRIQPDYIRIPARLETIQHGGTCRIWYNDSS